MSVIMFVCGGKRGSSIVSVTARAVETSTSMPAVRTEPMFGNSLGRMRNCCFLSSTGFFSSSNGSIEACNSCFFGFATCGIHCVPSQRMIAMCTNMLVSQTGTSSENDDAKTLGVRGARSSHEFGACINLTPRKNPVPTVSADIRFNGPDRSELTTVTAVH